jgi:hypothetical protein
MPKKPPKRTRERDTLNKAAKMERNRFIRVVRGARKVGNPDPGYGAWRNEWLDATEHSGKRVNRDGRILTDHSQVVSQTERLRAEFQRFAAPHFGLR